MPGLVLDTRERINRRQILIRKLLDTIEAEQRELDHAEGWSLKT